MTEFDLDEMQSTPAGFARGVLGLDLYEKQENILNEFWDQHGRVKVSVRAPNGSGKSSVLIPALALRNLATCPQGRIIITSKDSRQLDEQVWPALESHRGKFDFEWYQRYVLSPEGGFIIGFTTDDPARAEGWHAKVEPPRIDSPVTIICDEAKSIPDPIFEAFSGRCTFNALLYISSTGELSGAFARSQDQGSDFSSITSPMRTVSTFWTRSGSRLCVPSTRATIRFCVRRSTPSSWTTLAIPVGSQLSPKFASGFRILRSRCPGRRWPFAISRGRCYQAMIRDSDLSPGRPFLGGLVCAAGLLIPFQGQDSGKGSRRLWREPP